MVLFGMIDLEHNVIILYDVAFKLFSEEDIQRVKDLKDNVKITIVNSFSNLLHQIMLKTSSKIISANAIQPDISSIDVVGTIFATYLNKFLNNIISSSKNDNKELQLQKLQFTIGDKVLYILPTDVFYDRLNEIAHELKIELPSCLAMLHLSVINNNDYKPVLFARPSFTKDADNFINNLLTNNIEKIKIHLQNPYVNINVMFNIIDVNKKEELLIAIYTYLSKKYSDDAILEWISEHYDSYSNLVLSAKKHENLQQTIENIEQIVAAASWVNISKETAQDSVVLNQKYSY